MHAKIIDITKVSFLFAEAIGLGSLMLMLSNPFFQVDKRLVFQYHKPSKVSLRGRASARGNLNSSASIKLQGTPRLHVESRLTLDPPRSDI